MRSHIPFAITSFAAFVAAAPLDVARQIAPAVSVKWVDARGAQIIREVKLDGTPLKLNEDGQRTVSFLSLRDDKGFADSTCSAFNDQGQAIRGTNQRDLFFKSSDLVPAQRVPVFAIVCASAQSFPRSPGPNPSTAVNNNNNNNNQGSPNPPSTPPPNTPGEDDNLWVTVSLEDDDNAFVQRMAILGRPLDISRFIKNGILRRAEISNVRGHNGAICDTFADVAGTKNLNKPFGVNTSGIATQTTDIGVNVKSVICQIP